MSLPKCLHRTYIAKFHLKRSQHISKALKKWVDTGLNKPTNESFAFAEVY